jgi:F-type H+-transporting ATPase subunit b
MAQNTSAHGTNAHTEAPGGHGSGFPPFDPSTFASQLVWLAVAFILLYVLMSRVALPRMTSILDTRRSRISGDLAEASRLKTQSDEAIGAYQQALADARARAQALAAEMRDKITAETEASRHAVEERLNARLAEAEAAITASKSAAMANVHSIAVDAAATIVRRLTGAAAPDAAVRAAVDDVLKR